MELRESSVYAGSRSLQERGVTDGTKRKKFCHAPKAPVLQG